jgi:hypothetical protein
MATPQGTPKVVERKVDHAEAEYNSRRMQWIINAHAWHPGTTVDQDIEAYVINANISKSAIWEMLYAMYPNRYLFVKYP